MSLPWLFESPADLESKPLRIAGTTRRMSPESVARLTRSVAARTRPHGLESSSLLWMSVSEAW